MTRYKWENKKATTLPSPATSPLDEKSAEIVSTALAHEKTTAAFYSELARTAPLPNIRNIFRTLAEEEQSHCMHLEEFATTGSFKQDHA